MINYITSGGRAGAGSGAGAGAGVLAAKASGLGGAGCPMVKTLQRRWEKL